MINIVYFGTTDFSATVLGALARQSGFTISAVVTQPVRPAGRSQTPTPSPVKITAERLGLTIFEPESLKQFSPSTLPTVDLYVVFAYGLLIPKVILDLPTHGTLNIHPSLLPKYRGPTPVQTALINGDTETGVTIMALDTGMDSGPILHQIKVAIDDNDSMTTLTDKLTKNAIPILLDLIPKWVDKKITATPQDHSSATICKLLSRDDGKIDWGKTSNEIYNLYRGLAPWPGIWTTWETKRLKLLSVTPSPLRGGTQGGVFTNDSHLYVGTADGSIEILTLQLEGKKPMDGHTFINGNQNLVDAVLPS